MLQAADIDAIERATLQAVAPEVVETLPGWLLPMDHGTVGRAHSAVPLHHGAHDLELLPTMLARYAAQGFEPRLRLPDLPCFQPWFEALTRRNWRREQPTLTMTGDVQRLLALRAGPPADLDSQADAGWFAVYLGEGLDPADGASRSRLLSRAAGTLFASVRERGKTVACGAASFGHGWLGVHGMRTSAERRGQGLAGRILQAMAAEASRRGLTRVFLQVDANNPPALALYRRAGFSVAWPYAYWRPLRLD